MNARPPSRFRLFLRWLLAPLLIMYGKRKPEHLHALRFHRFETEDDVEEVDRQMIADGLAQARSVSARGNAAATMYNKFVDEQSRGLVDLVGTFLLRAMKDPDAPAAVHRIVEKQWSLVWPGVRDQLYWDLAASMQLLDEEAHAVQHTHTSHTHTSTLPHRRLPSSVRSGCGTGRHSIRLSVRRGAAAQHRSRR